MFTSIDKALAAALGIVAFFVNRKFGINVPDEIIAFAVSLLVYLVPNKVKE